MSRLTQAQRRAEAAIEVLCARRAALEADLDQLLAEMNSPAELAPCPESLDGQHDIHRIPASLGGGRGCWECGQRWKDEE